MVTHELEDIIKYADYILLLKDKKIEKITPEEFKKDMRL